MNDKGKIIHTFKEWGLIGKFLQVEYHTEISNDPEKYNNDFVSSTIITKWIGKKIEDSKFELCKLSNYDCNYTIEELEENMNKRIEDAEYEVTRWNSLKEILLKEAKEKWFDKQNFSSLGKWTQYQDYYTNWKEIENED